MPFVTLADIKTKLLPSVIKVLEASDDDFIRLERDAAEIIAELSGLAIPASVNDAPEWVVTPAAWIINYLVLSTVSGISEDARKLAETNFLEARNICKNHRDNPTLQIRTRVFDIEGGYQ